MTPLRQGFAGQDLITKIRELREATGAPVIRVKKVLEEFGGDEKKAFTVLQKEGFEKAETKGERATAEGRVFSYVHHNGKIATLVEVLCETDFVAKNELFQELGKSIAMQVSFSNPKNEKDLLNEEFIKDPTKKISDLIKEVIAKTGENIRLGKFARIELGNG